MYISELITQLQVLQAQHGNIQVVVNDQQSFAVTLSIQDVVDAKTFEPIDKVVLIE